MIITEIYKTDKFGDVQIVEYKDSRNVTVKFLNTGSLAVFPAGSIRKGLLRDRFAPSVFGVGYLGGGKSGGRAGKKAYTAWMNMLRRCYCPIFHKRQPTYINCIVCDEWLNFGEFEAWYNDNYVEGFELDKDVKIKGNKEYSPLACSFVSHKENMVQAVAKKYGFKSPCGANVDIYNLSTFCDENNLHASHMCAVHNGKLKAHKGWTKAD